MKHLIKLVLTYVLLASAHSTFANHVVLLDLVSIGQGGPNASGNVLIFHDADGDDKAIINVRGLAARTTFTFVMAQSPNPNTLPIYLLTEFKTDRRGTATFDVEAELFNAFIGVNVNLEDANGVADVGGAGAVANGASTISMDFFRVYNTNGNANVFGRSSDELSGAIVLTSERIPDESDL